VGGWVNNFCLAWLGKANKTKEVIDGHHGGAASAIDLPMITPAVLAPTLTEVSQTLSVCSERSPLRIRPKPEHHSRSIDFANQKGTKTNRQLSHHTHKSIVDASLSCAIAIYKPVA
jgi:hypothetical protein